MNDSHSEKLMGDSHLEKGRGDSHSEKSTDGLHSVKPKAGLRRQLPVASEAVPRMKTIRELRGFARSTSSSRNSSGGSGPAATFV